MYDAIVASTLTVFSCLGVIVWMVITENLKQSKRKDAWSTSRKIEFSMNGRGTTPGYTSLKSQHLKTAESPSSQIKHFPYGSKHSLGFNDIVDLNLTSISAG